MLGAQDSDDDMQDSRRTQDGPPRPDSRPRRYGVLGRHTLTRWTRGLIGAAAVLVWLLVGTDRQTRIGAIDGLLPHGAKHDGPVQNGWTASGDPGLDPNAFRPGTGTARDGGVVDPPVDVEEDAVEGEIPYRFQFPEVGSEEEGLATWGRKAIRFAPICVVELSGIFPETGALVTAEVIPHVDGDPVVNCPTHTLSANSLLVLVPSSGGPSASLRLRLLVGGSPVDQVDVPLPPAVPPLTVALARQQIRELLDWSWNGSGVRRAWRSRWVAGTSRSEALEAARAHVDAIRALLLQQYLAPERREGSGLYALVAKYVEQAAQDAQAEIGRAAGRSQD